MPYIIGIDTGGTFTDTVVIDEKGMISVGKALSTPPKYTEGIMKSLEAVAKGLKISAEELLKQTLLFSFGTTVASNAMATRSGSKTGLVTTVGAEDVIHIARGMSKWGGLPEAEIKHQSATRKPEPIVPKELIKGVIERIDWKGSIVCPLNLEQARDQIKSLANQAVESIAVSFLWSIRNPIHEQEVKRMISEMYPEAYISVSSEVSPTHGEYERSITTVIDAYVGPVTEKFLAALSKALKEKGLEPEILVMKADGGCSFLSEVLPIATFHSGPAGGVIAAKFIGDVLGCKDIISTDVGGTTFDVSLIRDGSVSYAREPVVEKYHVAYPAIDIISIGAGGGSIAWLDPAGRIMHVGPKSAGAYPGPACYGFSGVEPTVTDASLVLGYLPPDYFLGGRMKLFPGKAFEALKKLGDRLGMDVPAAAAAIYDIVNASMSDLITGITVRRGYDPREFVLFAFGGAGPVHAAMYGADLGVREVIVPSAASTYSALGLATSDLLHTRMLFDYNQVPMDPDQLNKNFETLEERVASDLDQDRTKEEDRNLLYFVEMRYGLQYHVVRLQIPRKKYGAEDMDYLASEFDRVYESIYGKAAGYVPAGRFITAFVVQGLGRTAKPTLLKHEVKGRDASGALKGKREAFFRKYNRYVTTDIYSREKLGAGNIIEGPAIIEAADTTVVIPPDCKGRMDEYLNIVIT